MRTAKDFRGLTDLINKTPIHIVGEMLGLQLVRNGSMRCPFTDHPDKRPSFSISEVYNTWICFGCNRRGRAIDFVKFYKGISFTEAKRWLYERTSSAPYRSPSKLQKRDRYVAEQNTPRSNEEPAADHELYHAFLELCPLGEAGRSYLLRRGLSAATTARFGIGQVSNSSLVLDELKKEFGFDRIRNGGLLTKRSSPSDARLIFPQNTLVFPFLKANRIAYLQGRLQSAPAGQGKWRNLNHRHPQIFNVDALSEQKSPISICEGVIDTLSAIELGLNAIGLLGVSTRLTGEQLALLRGRDVSILLDWDDVGEKRSLELKAEFRRHGITSTRKTRPSLKIKDLNEYLVDLRRKQ